MTTNLKEAGWQISGLTNRKHKVSAEQKEYAEMPKETKGEFRKLGVPTVVDRVVQQAMTQVLTPNIEDGYAYVVDMDLEKFFDTVCQSKLVEVLSLIHKYLNAGVISKTVF